MKDLSKIWQSLPTNTCSSAFSTTHSALTTLLLDDSFDKAILQPYNHAIVKEYDETARASDIVTMKTLRRYHLTRPKNSYSPESQIPSEQHDNWRRWYPPVNNLPRYDETLLAIVGILDCIKVEANVAKWIKNGGLSCIHESQGGADPVARKVLSSEPHEEALRRLRKPWFEQKAIMEHWVTRGIAVLGDLDIALIPGLLPAPVVSSEICLS